MTRAPQDLPSGAEEEHHEISTAPALKDVMEPNMPGGRDLQLTVLGLLFPHCRLEFCAAFVRCGCN